jgi:hypothetical protein
MLDLNIEIIKRMQAAALKARDSDKVEMRRRYDDLNEGLESAMSEHIFLRKNVTSLVERATILSNQVRPSSHSSSDLFADAKQSFEIQFSFATANSTKTSLMPPSAERPQWSIYRINQVMKLESSKP